MLSLAALPLTASEGQTRDDVFDDLLIARRHAVHVVLDDADVAAPHAVIVNRWTGTVTLQANVSAAPERNAASNVHAALADLDRQLAALGASRESIVLLNALVTTPRSPEGPAALAEGPAALAKLLADYLDENRNGETRRALLGVFELVSDQREAGSAAVVLNATVLDPRTATEGRRIDPGWDYRPAATRAFIIGSHASHAPRGAEARDRRTGRDGARPRSAPKAPLAARLEQLAILLRKLRAGPQDIHDMTIYYDPAAGLSEPELRAAVDAFFPGGAPRVDYVAPRVRYLAARTVAWPGAAVVVEASGMVTHDR